MKAYNLKSCHSSTFKKFFWYCIRTEFTSSIVKIRKNERGKKKEKKHLIHMKMGKFAIF